jgi:hypothetical protein
MERTLFLPSGLSGLSGRDAALLTPFERSSLPNPALTPEHISNKRRACRLPIADAISLLYNVATRTLIVSFSMSLRPAML